MWMRTWKSSDGSWYVPGMSPRNGISASASWARIFSFFFLNIFAIFDDFLKFHSSFCALHFKKSSNMAKVLGKKWTNPHSNSKTLVFLGIRIHHYLEQLTHPCIPVSFTKCASSFWFFFLSLSHAKCMTMLFGKSSFFCTDYLTTCSV